VEINIDVVMGGLSPFLDRLDSILRHGHATYETYPPAIVVDYDSSTQAHCTNRHGLAEAHRVLDELPNIRFIEIPGGQQLWLVESANSVLRFKKTDENGVSSNYPTSQTKAFDQGDVIPGLPPHPTRVTAGYLLDATGLGYMRSQVSLPTNRGVIWCAAIIPAASREADEKSWYEVTRQGRMF